jgi:hypothetical protein
VTLAYVHLKHGFTPVQQAFLIDPVVISQENVADMPIFNVPDVFLDNLRSEGIPEDILQDIQALKER